jgi:integrase
MEPRIPKHLTAAAAAKLRPGPKRRRIPDGGARSLFLIIEPSGHKSWQMRFRTPSGRIGKLTLGTFDPLGGELAGEPQIGQPLTVAAAHALAAWVHRERALGLDVIADHKARKHRQRAEAQQRAATSFGACVREFVVEHRVKKWRTRPRRWRETARVLGLDYPPGCDPAMTEPQEIKNGLADIWGNRAVAEIDDYLIHETVREAGKRGVPGLRCRNRGSSDARERAMYAALSVLFAWLKRERKVTSNPCAGVERPGPPPARERTLSEFEIYLFWRACDAVGEPFATIFKLLLLLGARLSELAGLRRDELRDDEWHIPSGRAKNHKSHALSLPPAAQALIAAVPGHQQIIFSTNGRTPPSGWSRAKHRLDQAMLKLAREEAKACGRNPDAVTVAAFRLHDLRRTFSTGLGERSVEPDVIELLLNHSSGLRAGIASTYNKSLRLSERRAALERWARFVALVVDRDLYAAHQRFVATGDVDRDKDRKERFNIALAEGGERWSRYLKTIATGGNQSNVVKPRQWGN